MKLFFYVRKMGVWRTDVQLSYTEDVLDLFTMIWLYSSLTYDDDGCENLL